MEASYQNIVLVCLDGSFCRFISQELAVKLDMFFADLKAYIEYDLVDSKAIFDTFGVEYLKKRELKSTKTFAKFQNTILTADFDLFKNNREAFGKESLIVYLKLPKKLLDKSEEINIISYQNRDEYLSSQSKVVVSLKSKNTNKTIKELLNKLSEAL